MAASKKGIVQGSAQDLEGLARIPDESTSPVMRTNQKGEILYANKFSRTVKGLINPKTEALDPVLVKQVKARVKAGTEIRIDYVVPPVTYELSIVPVAEFSYVNLYGRDVSEAREAVKRAEGLAKFPNENPNPVMRAESNGNVLFCNQASENIPGVIEAGPPIRLSPQLSNTARDAMRSQQIKSVNLETGEQTYLFTFSPVKGENYVNVYGRDISAEIEAQNALITANAQLEQRVAERTASVRLLQNIVLAANSADSLEAALQSALHEICIYTGWPVGHAYIVEAKEGHNELVPTGIWHIETASQFSDLRKATEQLRFGDSSNLPGQVMELGREVWIENLTTRDEFRRSEFIQKAGLKAAMAFPVTTNMQVIGVLEFFSQTVTPANTEIIKTLEHVGAQLGSVAERKRAEDALARSQNDAALAHSRLTDALEAMGQAFVLFDKEDHIVLFNRRYREVIANFTGGVEPKIGDHFSEQLYLHTKIRHADKGTAEQEAWVEQVLKSRASSKTRISSDQAPDGRWFRTEGFTTTEGGTVSIYTDITESKKHEEELARLAEEAALAHSRLNDAIQSIRQAFILYDRDDRIVMLNQRAELFTALLTQDGTPPKVGETFESYLRRSRNPNRKFDSKTAREAWIESVLEKRRTTKIRNSIDLQPNGKWVRSEGFETSEGGIVSIFTDITEEKEHEAELDELVKELGKARDAAVDANSAKSNFLANMSHELRTPLNAIIGYSELLIDDSKDDGNEEYIPDLEKIQSAGKHLLGLINDILDLSKIEVGKIELFIEEFDVGEMLGDVFNTIKPLVEKNNNVLEIEIGKKVGKVNSDLTKLRQNLFNLLSNAAKFSKDSKLTLRAFTEKSKAGELLVFEVSDHGIGMTPEQLEKIFDPFTQADSSTSKNYGGTGLGLTITREFCRMLGGEITATSELGVGTTFTMKVLVDGSKLQDTEHPAAPLISGSVSENAPLILVIDDDPNVRDLLQRNLTNSGYRTATAINGKQGLEYARKLSPDAITLDVIMPHADGWVVLTKLKADPATADIPVIMVTISEDKSLGFSLGASEFLSKPVDRKKLVSALDRFLGTGKNRTVLLIEDDEDTRDIMRKYLENENTTVIEAANGRIGIEKLAEATPALILLDLMMPELDGFGFIEEYRNNPEWHGVPIIVITAKNLTKSEKARLDGWVEGFYSKLDASIENVLENVSALLPPVDPPKT